MIFIIHSHIDCWLTRSATILNSESIVKYVIEKNLFFKVVCAFVSVYSISVIFSKVSQSEWNGLMGISKFLEWVHFNALAKPIADISIFLQQTPWSGGLWNGEGGIIVTLSMVSLFFSAAGMGRIMDGGAQATAFTIWSFVLIDYSSPILVISLIFIFVLLGFASYKIENKISMESFVFVVANIFFSIILVPLILGAIISGNMPTRK